MVTVEVVDTNGRVIELRRFKSYAPAVEWYDQVKQKYGSGIVMRFEKSKPIAVF